MFNIASYRAGALEFASAYTLGDAAHIIEGWTSRFTDLKPTSYGRKMTLAMLEDMDAMFAMTERFENETHRLVIERA